jgi:hypothetical protein
MRRPPTTLLDLGRKFRDDEDRLEDWEAVLKYPYVVVLGEAGTGKSSEFRLRQQRLAADGHFAFFVEISELANSGLVSNVDIDDESRIAEWQNSQCDAVFFLDSLDEAKLRNNTLQQALRRLQRELRGQWDRVRLVVSCRPSDWMAEADREVLQSVAPPGVSNVHVVKLAPLDPSQVGRLAQAAGVVDVGRLMEAVADSDAYVFVERPLDVQWLGSYWVRHQRFGSLRELIEDNVREKLKESPDRPSMLPLKKAEEGIETLAGVATINNTWSFVVPEPGASLDVQRASGSMEPQDFLRDWSSVEVGELLRRPVFDEATYGRVRLHHRTVQEFLAARWLYGLISSGLAHARVEEIFLRGGAIPAHLGPVAAWLALWDEEIRRLLIREAPLLLIGHGDPSGFRDDVRREILRAYASSYNGRKRLFETFDHASLQRFATPALADQIKALLAGPDVQDDLVWFLLQVVEYGRIVACADICVRLALDLSRSDDVRFRAIRAVASVGSDADRSALLALLHSTSTWDQDVAGAFVDTLYPALLGAQGLMDLLKIVEPKRRNVTTSLQLVLQEKVPEKGSVELRLELLTALLHVVWVPDATTGLHAVPSEEQWLFPALREFGSSGIPVARSLVLQPEGVTAHTHPHEGHGPLPADPRDRDPMEGRLCGPGSRGAPHRSSTEPQAGVAVGVPGVW